jgi:hypothetical protein
MQGACKAQAIFYQFFIWCVMGFWIAVVMTLHHVVHKKPEPRPEPPLPPGQVTRTEWHVYVLLLSRSSHGACSNRACHRTENHRAGSASGLST